MLYQGKKFCCRIQLGTLAGHWVRLFWWQIHNCESSVNWQREQIRPLAFPWTKIGTRRSIWNTIKRSHWLIPRGNEKLPNMHLFRRCSSHEDRLRQATKRRGLLSLKLDLSLWRQDWKLGYGSMDLYIYPHNPFSQPNVSKSCRCSATTRDLGFKSQPMCGLSRSLAWLPTTVIGTARHTNLFLQHNSWSWSEYCSLKTPEQKFNSQPANQQETQGPLEAKVALDTSSKSSSTTMAVSFQLCATPSLTFPKKYTELVLIPHFDAGREHSQR